MESPEISSDNFQISPEGIMSAVCNILEHHTLSQVLQWDIVTAKYIGSLALLKHLLLIHSRVLFDLCLVLLSSWKKTHNI